MLTLGADGTLTQQPMTIPASPYPLPNPYKPYMPTEQPVGIALANGYIYMTNYFSVTLGANSQPASTFSIYNVSNGSKLGGYTFTDAANTNTPSFPYAVAAKSDGSRAYVASQRDGCVYVLNTTDPANISLVSTIPNLTASLGTASQSSTDPFVHSQCRERYDIGG